jgi:peptide/nickel transport system substrate-binding protein
MFDRVAGTRMNRRGFSRGVAGLSGAAALAGLAQHPVAGAAARQAEGSPQPGGTLRIGTSQDVRTLDPHTTTGSADKPVFNVFNALTRGGENGDVLPELAESWEVSDNGLTYTFSLRPGVLFHNGRELVADDVIFSYNRVLDEALGSRYRGQLTGIEAMEAVDDHTLQITLNAPFTPFLVYLQDVRIVPEEAADELGTNPIGTGPWRFGEWMPNDHLTLVKNPDYWEEGLPYLDELTYQVVRDQQSGVIAFETGNLDMVLSDVLSSSDILEFQENPDVTLIAPPVEASYDVILFDNAHPPTDDVRVRRAIAHAFNRDIISEVVYDGLFPPAYTLFPPEHWAYNPDLTQPAYDLEAAAALFEEAGVTSLSFITWAVDPQLRQIAEILQQELAQIGVQLEVRPVETAQLIEQVYPTDRTYEIANTGYLREIDPDGWLKYFYAPNETNYSNPELEEVLIAARSEQDQAARKELYDQAQEIILEDVPKLFLCFKYTWSATQPNVAGVSVPYKGDEPYLREAWLVQ